MPRIDRRSLFAGSSAALAMSQLAFTNGGAMAAPLTGEQVAPRGKRGIFRRLPDLNFESYHDFLRGVRQWNSFYGLARACEERAKVVLKAEGAGPKELPLPKLLEIAQKDPHITLYGRGWLDGQYYKFYTLRELFHSNADVYLSEMEENDKKGPGTLELNPTMHIPDYTKHEIHTQLGGYVGDPFAGYIYLYDVLILNDGRDEQDGTFLNIANNCPLPKDGKVKRILDLGTGAGQLATSFQRRFPEAEVWGIDVGGPMVRYAHVRANDIGSKVNFAQRLAEDTKFPDNYFDIVTSMQMHHEVTADASRAIFKELQRIIRPGGHYYPIDVKTSTRSIDDGWGLFRNYLTYRWNHEDWWMEWHDMDHAGEMRKAGLQVDENGPASGFNASGSNNLVAWKV